MLLKRSLEGEDNAVQDRFLETGWEPSVTFTFLHYVIYYLTRHIKLDQVAIEHLSSS